MATTLLVTHPVTDFQAWRAAFDAAEPIRRQHGATSVQILTDSSGVVGLLEFPDDASAQSFLADPALRTPLPGVPSRPEVRVLTVLVDS